MKKTNIKHNQSSSLWNYTLSPGWSVQEVDVLKRALMKFGIGRWRKIIDSECLPGKSIGQIYLQTQRLMGQQSLGEYMGLHIDIQKLFIDNSLRTNVTRKNNTIVNTGDNPTKEERARKIAENQEKYGISEECWRDIKLPKKNKSIYKSVIMLEEVESNKFSTIEKIHHIIELQKLVNYKIELIKKFGNNYFKDETIEVAGRQDQTKSTLRKKKILKSKKKKNLHYDYSSEEEEDFSLSETESDCDSTISRARKGSVSVILLKLSDDDYQLKEVIVA
jgi:hypothetical protein